MAQQPATPDGDGGMLEAVSWADVRLLYAVDFWD
jgi:hypothetical protein